MSDEASEDAALCRAANEALLHRAAKRRPFSVWKYAMTLDGKIATTTGHASWVSSAHAGVPGGPRPASSMIFCQAARQRCRERAGGKERSARFLRADAALLCCRPRRRLAGPTSRAAVHDLRANSDAVIIGGETLRRDNPILTTRRQTGHIPARIVLTRSCDMPMDRHLWDVSAAPTIVMTEAGADAAAIRALRQRGVEVIVFDKLLPGKARCSRLPKHAWGLMHSLPRARRRVQPGS